MHVKKIDPKAPNYTEDMVTQMVEEYTAEPNSATVDRLAVEFGKSRRSIIAKLSHLGLYVVPQKTNKAGKPIIKKDMLVQDIERMMGLNCPSFVKANKQDLERFVAALQIRLEEEYFG